MMYEMLAGRVPFEADNSMAILVAHAQDTCVSVSVRPDLAIPFEVEEAIAQPPGERPAGASADG